MGAVETGIAQSEVGQDSPGVYDAFNLALPLFTVPMQGYNTACIYLYSYPNGNVNGQGSQLKPGAPIPYPA
jgi:hypothetical protein